MSPVRRASRGWARFKAGLASVAVSHERILLLDHRGEFAEAQLTLERAQFSCGVEHATCTQQRTCWQAAIEFAFNTAAFDLS